ncbi:MAG: PHP domain-containing protein [candidate division WOR-3 bacterium]|nr:MAG: PHP domain-containing protein [candidate division WOR-3 bacterium]
MPRCYRADLHVHTCLSPCADLTMSPKRIVETGLKKDLDIIAVCDHNSAENVAAAIKASRNTELTVLAGMEITSSEEAHVIGLFSTSDAAQILQDLIYENLTAGDNDERLFGAQIVVNEFDEIEGYNKRLLIGATNLTIGRIVDEIHRLKGIAIASHVDREAYSIIGQLGFIPEDLDFDALEISSALTIAEAKNRFPEIDKYTLVSSSDAHFLDDIGNASTQLMLEDPTLEELRKAFRKIDGRCVLSQA